MYPLSTAWKHQKTLRFSDVFRGYRKEALGTNSLRKNIFVLHTYDKFYTKIILSCCIMAPPNNILHRVTLKHLANLILIVLF